MISNEAQLENFTHLKEICEHQKRVRDCEIEGSVRDIEKDLTEVYCLGLITLVQEDLLQGVLKERIYVKGDS